VAIGTVLCGVAGLMGCSSGATGTGEPLAHTLDNMSWMVGTWRGAGLDGEIEEVFLEPRAGAIPAFFRLVHPGEDGAETATFYEFILVEQNEVGDGDGAEGTRPRITYRLHHFNPGLSRWEDEPVEFELIRLTGSEALFKEVGDTEENSRLRYRRTGDTMTAELIERGKVDEVKARFEYARVR
jgi:hypothetical protein